MLHLKIRSRVPSALSFPAALVLSVFIPSSSAQSCFETFPRAAVGGQPTLPELVDLNNDGRPDLVCALTTAQISIALNDGQGRFPAYSLVPVDSVPKAIASADFDGDGDIDLIVACGVTNSFSFLANNGDGTFAAQIPFGAAPGVVPGGIVAGDLDGDGDVDFVSVNTNPWGVRVYLNAGTGTFVGQSLIPVNVVNGTPVLADLDSDGDLDLTFGGGPDGSNVVVFLNPGNGVFGFYASYPSGTLTGFVTTGDFDADGDIDVAAASGFANVITVLPNLGNGTLGAGVTYYVEFGPGMLRSADIVGDAGIDLVVVHAQVDGLRVLENVGNGVFQAHSPVPIRESANAFAMADLDGDNDLDFCVSSPVSDGIVIAANRGSGELHAPQVLPVSARWNYSVNKYLTTLDHDSDGDVDLAASNGVDPVVLLYENGPGVSSPAPIVIPVTGKPQLLRSADFDGDGDPDLAVVTSTPTSTVILLNQGGGVFSPVSPPSQVTGTWECADFDGDGDVDLLSSSAAGVVLLANQGNGTMASPANVGVGLLRCVVGDLDADGDVDVAGIRAGDGRLVVLRNSGAGTFTLSETLSTTSYPIALMDFDSDGDLDFVGSGGSNILSIFRNQGGTFVGAPTNIPIGFNVIQLLVDDRDGDGDSDLCVIGGEQFAVVWKVRVLENQGSGLLSPGPVVETINMSDARFVDWDGDGDRDLVYAEKGLNRIFVMNDCRSPAVTFCAGDGSSAACPCANSGASGHGCANSSASAGALLTASGNAVLSSDSLVLSATGMSNGPGMFLQSNGPALVPFGDGLLCVGSQTRRLAVVFAANGSSMYPNLAFQAPLHVVGEVQVGGSMRHYQLYYRDASAGFCTPATFNTSNGVSLTWVP